MHNHEPDSDDDSIVDDEEESFLPLSPVKAVQDMQPLSSSALQFVEIITDHSLQDIATQLLSKEREAEEEIIQRQKEWEKSTAPEMKKKVDALESQIDKIKSQLKSMSTPPEELELTLDSLISQHKKLCCKLYFPHSVHRKAEGGLYFAVDDFWLEEVCGKFHLELLPAMGSDVGQLVFVLSGQQDGRGVGAKFHMTNFKLKADHMLVPSLTFDHMDVEVEFTVTVVLAYDMTQKKWTTDENDFKVDILDFDGPFGLTKGVLCAILGIVTPLVKRKVLKEVPVELGSFIASLPCPLQVNGEFRSDGQPNWEEVRGELVASSTVCSLMKQTPAQVLNIQGVQLSMQRLPSEGDGVGNHVGKLLSTLHDLILYYRRFHSTSAWPAISDLWQDACDAYHSQTSSLEPSDTADDPSQQDFTKCVSFRGMCAGAHHATKVPVGVEVDVKMIEGQYGIKNMIEQSNLFAKRIIREMSTTQQDKFDQLSVAEQQLLESMKKAVLKKTNVFEFLLERVDFMQGKSSVHVESGEESLLTGTFDNLSGQFPVAVYTGLPANKIIGGNIVVPTLTKLETTKEGVLCFRFFQLGSLEMLEKCNLLKWLQDDLPDDEGDSGALSATELAELRIHQPSVSFIMDQPVAMSPGASLVTVQVGPLEPTWTPDGAKAQTGSEEREKYLATIKPLGEACPVLVQTSPQVKILGKVPKVTTEVNLSRLMAFLNKHFEDLDVLLDVISLTSGAGRDACMQYINFAQIVLNILTKYVLKPGLQLDVNMSTRVIANSADIIVCLENRVPGTSAVDLKAKIDFREILHDFSTLKSALFSAINHKSIIF